MLNCTQVASPFHNLSTVLLRGQLVRFVRDLGSAAGRGDVSGTAQLRIANPSYFATMGVEILNGSAFTESDTIGRRRRCPCQRGIRTAPARWPALEPYPAHGLDACVKPRPASPKRVPHRRHRRKRTFQGTGSVLRTRRLPQHAPVPAVAAGDAVTDSGGPLSLAAAAREVIRRVDAAVPVGSITMLKAILAEPLVMRPATTHVIDGVAGCALALAGLGLYGLLALLGAAGSARPVSGSHSARRLCSKHGA
jgi:hypothetical protein